MSETMKSYYVKVRPTNGGLHNKKVAYDFWTTVYDGITGDSYLSIQDVPAGIEITNAEYWTLYSRNDARYEYLLGLLKNLQGSAATSAQVTALQEQLTSLIAASGETEGNTELQDIRNGADGETYETAGEAVREQLKKKMSKDDAMSWSQWFDLHRTGWHGGVKFSRFGTSQSVIGTGTGDNADLVAETSTNTSAGRNDYKNQSVTDLMFNGIVVNGYIDEDGDPHITAVKGSPEFAADGSNGDVYVAYLTPFYKRIYTDTEEGWDFSDHPEDGMEPWDPAVRPDGTYRSYYFVAKYPGVDGTDGNVASISGKKLIRSVSHNSQITRIRAKGEQYCGWTSRDCVWAMWMCDMKFKTKDSGSKLKGAINNYYYQYEATVKEENVKRIIISKANANNLIVGSCVSIGYGTIYNGTVDWDRGRSSNPHKYADCVRITKIDTYDDNNSAVYVDVDEPFDTTDVALSDSLTSPVKISTMPWWSGTCDDVQGPDGSPTSPTGGREPFVLSNVELGHGAYTVVSDVILDSVYDSGADKQTITPYIVDDSRKIATSVTDDYTEIGYKLPSTDNTWKYISELGYDPRYPFLQLPTEVNASTSTGYADGLHTGAKNTSLREWLWFGCLWGSSNSGLRCVDAAYGLGATWWPFSLRLSSLRRGVAAQG